MMARCKWLVLLLLIPALCGFDTRNPFRTRGPFKAADFTIGSPTLGACKDGVDCLCDRISTTSTLLFCEDWEDVDYYDDTANSWIAGEVGDGGAWNRGADSQWENWYGNGDHGFFKYSDGVPTIGTRCGFGSGSSQPSYQGCTGQREYCSAAQGAITTAGAADCWGPIPSDGASLDVQRTGDFDAEVPTLTLQNGVGAGTDIGGGNQAMAFRVPPGNNVGKIGTVYLKAVTGRGTSSDNTNVTELGITMALAYSPNILTETDSVMGYNGGANQWKHNEYAEDGQVNQEHFNLGNTG